MYTVLPFLRKNRMAICVFGKKGRPSVSNQNNKTLQALGDDKMSFMCVRGFLFRKIGRIHVYVKLPRHNPSMSLIIAAREELS